jgi:hypothetical protein
MLQYVWLSGKNKANSAIRNRILKKGNNENNENDEIKPPVDACVEDYPDGNFNSPFLLTFHSFETDTIIVCPVGGTAAEAVELAGKNEAANPSWDLICSNRKDQHMVDKQLACRGGRKILGLKRQTELAQQLVRQRAKKQKQKQKQITAIHQTMETANKLQMVQLYQPLGEEGKAREILQSVQNSVNTLEVMPSEEEGNESDKETTTTITSTSNTTMTSHESDS